MSTASKTVIGIIAAVVIIGGIAWYVSTDKNQSSASPAAYNAPANVQNQPSASTTDSAQLSQGSSDQDLDQDMVQVNTQMNAYASDSANVDQGLNDQPVSQN